MKVFSKNLMLVALSLFTCNVINAQVGGTIPDVTIAAGGKATVSLELNDDVITTYIGMNFTLTLPDGFTIDTTSGKVTERTDDHTLTIKKSNSGNSYKFSLFSMSSAYLSGTSGSVFTFDLLCDETVENGDYELKMSASSFNYIDPETETNAKVRPDDATFKITVGAAATAEDITLANEWNTYCSTNDLDFSSIEGVEAYVVSDVTATSAKLEAVTVVPKGVGFLIKGTAEQKISVPFAESAGSVTSKLVGVTTDTTLDGGNYVLSGDQFVLCSEGGTLPAHKAYLPGSSVTSGAKAFGFDFGDATGINEAKAAKADGAIYSISGVRVAEPQKGVYIMNGRKVIVK